MNARTESTFTITGETLIPDVLRLYPQLRPVFDRYGLKGCGGADGPHETIHFFSRAHDVEEIKLLSELKDALDTGSNCASVESPESSQFANSDLADTIYRRYFSSAIFVILTFGATWGAWLLWRIAFDASFTTVSANEINAHGQAQVFGWMGLFMMGFAYQAFPRFWHTTLSKPPLAVLCLILMLTGVVTASAGTALAGHWNYSLLCAELGSLLELAGVTIFSGQIVATWRRSGKPLEAYIAYIFVALSWFIASTAYNAWHTFNTVASIDREQLLYFVSTYQAPLRDMQFHGLAMTMIFGVSLRTLPHLFGLPKCSDKRAWYSLVLLTIAVLSETALFITYKLNHNEIFATLLIFPSLLMTIASATIVLPFKLWKLFPEPDRSTKFIRVAFAWLFVSLLMLLLQPINDAVNHTHFSHAYSGAIRHASTVGFISMMIMGYALKIVPTLNGLDARKMSPLWGPFILVNLGCLLRVSMQTLSEWIPSILPYIGISGTFEVIGFAWWGYHLVEIMLRAKRESQVNELAKPSDSTKPKVILPEHIVADVLAWYPETETAFVMFGFEPVLNPLMRRTVARQVTIGQACRTRAVSSEDFLLALNAAITPYITPDSSCSGTCGSCSAH